MYKRIIIWVEGPHDAIFFRNIIKKSFEENGFKVQIKEYNGDEIKGELMNESVNKLINYIESEEYKISSENKYCPINYIFIKDFDNGHSYNEKKEEIKDLIKKIDENKIVLVKKIIESWYLSGLNKKNCKIMGIPAKKVLKTN